MQHANGIVSWGFIVLVCSQQQIGEFVLTHKDIKVPSRGKVRDVVLCYLVSPYCL
jgi:hypothetical protein